MINILAGLDKGQKFEMFFALAILLPGFPDDLLVYDCRTDQYVNKEIYVDQYAL